MNCLPAINLDKLRNKDYRVITSVALMSPLAPLTLTLPIIYSMTETNVQDIQVHEPGSKHSSLLDGPGGFDRTWFMGTWGVAWSTLPMWEKTRGGSFFGNPSALSSQPTNGLGSTKLMI
jgi:hypothetical protein